MAITKSSVFGDDGVYVATVSIVASTATTGIVDVGRLRDPTIQVVRTGSTDSIAVTGSNDGTNFAAVTSDTQAASADTALTAVTAGVYTIRQKVRYLRFVASGTTDTFTITVIGKQAR